MPETYPLDALLFVRGFREEAAKRRVTSAQFALKQANEKVQVTQAQLEAWRLWREEETERRYQSLLGKPTRIEAINRFNADLGRMAQDELVKLAAVEEAKAALLEAENRLATAKDDVRKTRKETAKIETHKAIWSEESKKEAERAEELEFEDFIPLKPVDDES
ncbi:MAG: YscO family type III secretion system apparatus protein [Duodenibacillus sp.]|nr:YscO family type III secretion system apparatus protein [Duodenibacillus sp.]